MEKFLLLLEYLFFILLNYRRYVQPIIHTMVLIGLAVLLVFVVILMFSVSWMKFDDSYNKNTPMDLVLYGPQKYTSKLYFFNFFH